MNLGNGVTYNTNTGALTTTPPAGGTPVTVTGNPATNTITYPKSGGGTGTTTGRPPKPPGGGVNPTGMTKTLTGKVVKIASAVSKRAPLIGAVLSVADYGTCVNGGKDAAICAAITI